MTYDSRGQISPVSVLNPSVCPSVPLQEALLTPNQAPQIKFKVFQTPNQASQTPNQAFWTKNWASQTPNQASHPKSGQLDPKLDFSDPKCSLCRQHANLKCYIYVTNFFMIC